MRGVEVDDGRLTASPLFVAASVSIVFLLSIGASAFAYWYWTDNQSALQEDIRALQAQIIEKGDTPVVPPGGIEVKEPEKGEQGDPGRPPTPGEVAVAVRDYIEENPVSPGRAPPAKKSC